MDRLRIATRNSPLALWQAQDVRAQLLRQHPQLRVELISMTTQGDRLLDTSLAAVGGKGLFLKELEDGLLRGRADIAVHSMKDVTVSLPEGLHIAVICERADPSDALVSNTYASIGDMPAGARIGTSSLRRRCQLSAAFPSLVIENLRGNVNTRLRRLDEGGFDAIILAAAGLRRLGLADRISAVLDTETSLPAVGQGAVGIECRSGDAQVETLLAPLNHSDSALRVRAERAMNAALNGGCQVPIAGYAELHEGQLHLRGLVGSVDGKQVLRAAASGPVSDPEALGRMVAEDLLHQGAGVILDALYDQH